MQQLQAAVGLVAFGLAAGPFGVDATWGRTQAATLDSRADRTVRTVRPMAIVAPVRVLRAGPGAAAGPHRPGRRPRIGPRLSRPRQPAR